MHGFHRLTLILTLLGIAGIIINNINNVETSTLSAGLTILAALLFVTVSHKGK